MAMPSTGKDLAVVRNINNGRFDLTWDSTGNPLFSDDASHVVLSLLLEFQGLWWADSTGKRGSLLYTVKQDTSATASILEQYIRDALQPAFDDNHISAINTLTVTRTRPGRYEIALIWTTPSGVQGSTILPL